MTKKVRFAIINQKGRVIGHTSRMFRNGEVFYKGEIYKLLTPVYGTKCAYGIMLGGGRPANKKAEKISSRTTTRFSVKKSTLLSFKDVMGKKAANRYEKIRESKLDDEPMTLDEVESEIESWEAELLEIENLIEYDEASPGDFAKMENLIEDLEQYKYYLTEKEKGKNPHVM